MEELVGALQQSSRYLEPPLLVQRKIYRRRFVLQLARRPPWSTTPASPLPDTSECREYINVHEDLDLDAIEPTRAFCLSIFCQKTRRVLVRAERKALMKDKRLEVQYPYHQYGEGDHSKSTGGLNLSNINGNSSATDLNDLHAKALLAEGRPSSFEGTVMNTAIGYVQFLVT